MVWRQTSQGRWVSPAHGTTRPEWGRSTSSGTFLCGRGRSTPSGTGILSPNAQLVPGREKVHPHAQDVPGRRKDAMWTVRMGGLIMVGSHPGASRATPLASSQPQLNHLLRASTRTPTARIRRATAVKTSLTFRAVTLPRRTFAFRPFGLDTALTQLRAEQLHIPSGACASHAVADVLAGIAGPTDRAVPGPALIAAGRSRRRAPSVER